ncbi:MAG: sigma-54 dependent transcriptional regulator [bacterium]
MHARPILIVDDEPAMREAILEVLNRKGYEALGVASGREALERIDRGGIRLVITDVRMPEMDGLHLLREGRRRAPWLSFLLMTAFGTVEQAVQAVKEGASDYLLKPFTMEELIDKIRAVDGGSCSGKEKAGANGGLITGDGRMLEILETARGVAASDVNVVITGESGTGKELLARYIHAHSPRRAHPLVTVNCASIPETLLESELFGHEKGAFTGADHRRTGKFELADRSTLLLDEIGEMRVPLQAKLLRVVQEKEVERVGGEKPVAVDFRVLATTNRDLAREVADGRFREDLYYRLNVIHFHLPALRERLQDIPLLVDHFSREVTQRLGMPPKAVSAGAMKALQERPWRGNVRELRNVIERAVVLCRALQLGVEDLLLGDRLAARERPDALSQPAHGLRAMEKDLILKTLKEAGGNRTQTARRLGISVRTLRNKLKEYGPPIRDNSSGSACFSM